MHLYKIALSLGSNKGNRSKNLQKAVEYMKTRGIHILKLSSVIETLPWDNADQDPYLNMAVLAETALTPYRLLKALKKIEKDMGRTSGHMEPREIDIDIIFYEKRIIKSKYLSVPHPRFREREFVLKPLAEIIPHFIDPETNKEVISLYRELLAMPYVGTVYSSIGPFSIQVKDNNLIKASFSNLKGRKDYNKLVKKILEKLKKFFKAIPVDFTDIPVNLNGLPLTYKRILKSTRKIPYGKIKTYSEVAEMAGLKNGARVVGNALKNNPIPIIIPCHRVVRKRGLGGYSSGIKIKEFLLKLELKNDFFRCFPKCGL